MRKHTIISWELNEHSILKIEFPSNSLLDSLELEWNGAKLSYEVLDLWASSKWTNKTCKSLPPPFITTPMAGQQCMQQCSIAARKIAENQLKTHWCVELRNIVGWNRVCCISKVARYVSVKNVCTSRISSHIEKASSPPACRFRLQLISRFMLKEKEKTQHGKISS